MLGVGLWTLDTGARDCDRDDDTIEKMLPLRLPGGVLAQTASSRPRQRRFHRPLALRQVIHKFSFSKEN